MNTEAPARPRARIQALQGIKGSTPLSIEIINAACRDDDLASQTFVAMAMLQLLVDRAGQHPSDRELLALQPFTKGNLTVADLRAIMAMADVTKWQGEDALMKRVCPQWSESMQRCLICLSDVLYDNLS